MIVLLVGVSIFGLATSLSPSTLNNVAFASLHVAVLTAGIWAALAPQARAPERAAAGPEPEAAFERPLRRRVPA
jgi:hypothetical protein